MLVIAFDRVLEQHYREELSSFCDTQFIRSMQDLEFSNIEPGAVIYLMDYTSSAHLHNIEYIRNKYSSKLFFVISSAVSIPLLHQSIHLGVNDLFISPLNEQDKKSLRCNLMNKTQIACNSLSSEFSDDLCCETLDRDNPISELLDIIERDYIKGPSLQDLAHDVHLSPSRICHMFKDLCGITYSQYLICRKLEEGERLLISGDNSVTTIAYQVGFSNPSHFCRSFKEHLNITPTAYVHANNELKQSPTYIHYQRVRSDMMQQYSNQPSAYASNRISRVS
ncbi:helix-turn-helix domain-containing protein [Thalassomonas sp. M1454]|uniref:helix-turn-helix domain-containing protein n=1 Tax=Thalassomonas sp. M1454 TaxID=2594477 RepID=UPI00163D95F9|nr:AraC family transcriptional regulator [Thalassomonas sp. M1454]